MDTKNKILDDIKRPLGLEPDYDVYDPEIIMHINGVFATLYQLGVGPKERAAYLETGEETWGTFFDNVNQGDNLANVRTYIYMKVRLVFDPPTTSFAITAMEKQIQEIEWRINVQGDHSSPTNT